MNLTDRPLSWIYTFDENEADEAEETEESLEIPEDLTVPSVTDDDLILFENELVATFEAIRGSSERLTNEDLAELRTIQATVQRVRGEKDRRAAQQTELDAEAERLAAEVVIPEGGSTETASTTTTTPEADNGG